MEQLNLALLNNALTTTGERSPRRLPDADYAQLVVLFDQMQTRYPSQDLAEATEGFLADYESLALEHGLPLLQMALAAMRIKPSQKFFPRPDEVAEEIEHLREQRRVAREREARAARRRADIEEFWKWAPEWMEMAGFDEEELLRRWPSYRGTRPVAMENAT